MLLASSCSPGPKAKSEASSLFKLCTQMDTGEDKRQRGVWVISACVCERDPNISSIWLSSFSLAVGWFFFPFYYFFFFFGKRLHVQRSVDLREIRRQQETSHGFVAWQWQWSCLTSYPGCSWLCSLAIFSVFESICVTLFRLVQN